jgi:hypothetical protein
MPRTTAQPELPNLETSLNGLTVEYLKWYAGALGGPVPTRKAELVRKIQGELTSTDALRSRYQQLSAGEQQVVSEVVHALGGIYDSERITAKYPEVRRPRHPDPYYERFAGRDFFVFGTRAERHPGATSFDLLFFHNYYSGIFVPPDLVSKLRPIAPPPPEARLETLDEPPAARAKGKRTPDAWLSDTERAALHDLQAALLAVQQGKVTVSTTTALPTLATVKGLRQRLQEADYFDDDYSRADDAIRPLALVMLIQAARWAAPTGSSGKLELSKAGQEVLFAGVQARHIREAWERWLKSDLLDELARVKGIRGQQAKGVRLTKLPERRSPLVEALRACPPGRWVDMRAFMRYLIATGLLPYVERGENRLYVGSSPSQYGWQGSARSYMELVPGSYVRALLFEYAATLGMVELVYTAPADADFGLGKDEDLYYRADVLSPYDGLRGFMLTALGAYALRLTDEYTPPRQPEDSGPPPLRVLPNLDIVVAAPERLTPNDRATLERVASPQSEGVWRLERALLTEAAEQGLGVEQVRTFLAARSGQPEPDMPQTVRVFLEDAERKLGALRDAGRYTLVEGDDPILLTQLANHPSLRASVRLVAIGERAALLAPEDQEAAVRRALKKLGYVPKRNV